MISPLQNKNNSDVILWQEFTEDSVAAYEGLYERFVDELYRYAYMIVKSKPLAEDVIHDVFTDLWSNRKNLGKIRSVRLYLFSSIKRRSLRKLKKEQGFAYFDQSQREGLSFEIAPSFLDELITVQDQELYAKKLKRYIAGLSNRQREIIYLRFYQDMSYAEIAELLQLDQKYVYNLASKAFVLLRKTIPKNLLLVLIILF